MGNEERDPHDLDKMCHPNQKDRMKCDSITVLYSSLLLVILSGCASGYNQFYTSRVDVKSTSDLELLEKYQEPELFGTNNFDRDIRILRSKGYVVIGESSFNGENEDSRNAVAQAKRVGATVVLVSSRYTNTQTTTTLLSLPDNKTTVHSGIVSGNTVYNGRNGGYLGSSSTSGIYQGTSTTLGTKQVPITTQQHRYDQNAVYLVKSNKKWKFGMGVADFNSSQRFELETNTGAIIDFVIEGSPAFYANLIPGDILISVDGKQIINANHASQLMNSVSPTKTSSELIVIRKGKTKSIDVQFL